MIFGANGFLGRYLTRHYLDQGREVAAVARHGEGIDRRAMFLPWDGRTPGPWSLALEGAALVVNLAGRSVDCRYDESNRREILASRVDSTRAIGEAIAACKVPPRVWMNSSTATWYRDARDRPQDEWSGEPGEGFSVEVARAWEESFFSAKVPGAVRKVALRTGMVLADEPGTVLEVLRRLAKSGLGGRMGPGRQRVAWIHMEDFIGAMEHLEQDMLADGVFNLTAPRVPTNAELMRTLRETVAMPVGLPAARWMLEIGACLMRTETELVLKSRWVVPARLEAEGFGFRWPELGPAVADLLERPGVEGFFGRPVKRSVGHRAWVSPRRVEPA
ncbi:TIGR01777 family oxidoreductase [Haloferula sargassicola]|uniref:TIGR01777 family oxidoreductase n=1 Tax=Haloferula sargassicola TaxID=490096 RepID=UPI0033655103